MEISVKFLLQSSRILSDKIYTEKDLTMIYNFVVSIDNLDLIEYFNSKTIFSYNNDLELFQDVCKTLLSIFEKSENYEYCHEIQLKLNESELIKQNKK